MKVILNEDVKHLGEIGDVKNVADGYFRNYLFPRKLAVPCTPDMEAYFATRKAEIDARKEQKRKDSMGLKEKLEALEIFLSMPAGNNGKLFGAVTSQTISTFYANKGYDIERKRIEIPSRTIKNTGTYTVKVHLYEATIAEVKIVITAQEDTKAQGAETAKDKAAKTSRPESENSKNEEEPNTDAKSASAEPLASEETQRIPASEEPSQDEPKTE